jgi:hypothetical protein
VAALLEYDAGMPIVATFTERNSPIFHEDSDFEVRLLHGSVPEGQAAPVFLDHNSTHPLLPRYSSTRPPPATTTRSWSSTLSTQSGI